MDKQLKEELLRLEAETTSECREILASVTQSVQERYQRLAGSYLAEMMESEEATAKHLTSAHANLREAALLILEYHWGLTRSWAPTLERMVSEDQNDDIRGLALLNWHLYTAALTTRDWVGYLPLSSRMRR